MAGGEVAMPALTEIQERLLTAIRADGFKVARIQVSPRGVMTLTVYDGQRQPEYMMIWRFDRYGEPV